MRLILRERERHYFMVFYSVFSLYNYLPVSLICICQVYLQAIKTMHKIHPHSGFITLLLHFFEYIIRQEKCLCSNYKLVFIYFMFLSESWHCSKICIKDLHIRDSMAVMTPKFKKVN